MFKNINATLRLLIYKLERSAYLHIVALAFAQLQCTTTWLILPVAYACLRA